MANRSVLTSTVADQEWLPATRGGKGLEIISELNRKDSLIKHSCPNGHRTQTCCHTGLASFSSLLLRSLVLCPLDHLGQTTSSGLLEVISHCVSRDSAGCKEQKPRSTWTNKKGRTGSHHWTFPGSDVSLSPSLFSSIVTNSHIGSLHQDSKIGCQEHQTCSLSIFSVKAPELSLIGLSWITWPSLNQSLWP